jgi:central glycolytic genes regulator
MAMKITDGQIISLQRRIAPELTDVIVLRYYILRSVGQCQPVGRRVLATSLGRTEREIRREERQLRRAGLISVSAHGIRLTSDGEDILRDLSQYVSQLSGATSLEARLVEVFGLSRAIVVPGDSDADASAKKDMARAGARLLAEVLREGDVVAVTGGTTMAEMAAAAPASGPGVARNITVVPARGGLGEDVEKQADTVAASLAKQLGGSYRLLNLPDDLRHELLAGIVAEPRIRQLLHTITRARVVVHGVGTALEMARRRNFSEAEIERVLSLGAVGEAFGYYFNSGGEVVYTTSSLGLRLTELATVETVISIAGGASKGEALAAVLRNGFSHIVVTDEGAARRALHLASNER